MIGDELEAQVFFPVPSTLLTVAKQRLSWLSSRWPRASTNTTSRPVFRRRQTSLGGGREGDFGTRRNQSDTQPRRGGQGGARKKLDVKSFDILCTRAFYVDTILEIYNGRAILCGLGCELSMCSIVYRVPRNTFPQTCVAQTRSTPYISRRDPDCQPPSPHISPTTTRQTSGTVPNLRASTYHPRPQHHPAITSCELQKWKRRRIRRRCMSQARM